MSEEVSTISAEKPAQPGMDFALLGQQGVKKIQQLASDTWTDHNSHDPGITILEQLAYAITDLSYRLSFDMQDLLAYDKKDPDKNHAQFFTARQILACNPTTINDYRKLLIDIEGVKNCWFEINKGDEISLYCHEEDKTLGFSSSADLNSGMDAKQIESSRNSERVSPKGLYSVTIETSDASDDIDDELLAKVKSKLHQHRGIGEDFSNVRIIEIEEIIINAEIELEESADQDAILAQIYVQVADFISPDITFYTLSDRIKQGLAIEDIFNGPALEHGFIDNEELAKFDKRTELYVSDLVRIIHNIEGVLWIKEITVSSDDKQQEEHWILKLDTEKAPNLAPWTKMVVNSESAGTDDESTEAGKKGINFFKRGLQARSNFNITRSKLDSLKKHSDATTAVTYDLAIPSGEYRQLNDYEPIQNHFPVNYGIGEIGLPESASPTRKALAKQLSGYLSVFDQVLANYFSQLDVAKGLLSVNNSKLSFANRTYFAQHLQHLPDREVILKIADNREKLLALVEEETEGKDIELVPTSEQSSINTAFDRKSRLLDHLLARFGEKFLDSSELLDRDVYAYRRKHGKRTHDRLFINNETPAEKHIRIKQECLENYPNISAQRGKSQNYIDGSKIHIGENTSGLKERISKLLGIATIDNRQLAYGNQEGFHIVERILLRPPSLPRLFPYPRAIIAFIEHSDSIVICHSPKHGLKDEDEIQILSPNAYAPTGSTTYKVSLSADLPIDTENFFAIGATFVVQELSELNATTGLWDYTDDKKFPRLITKFAESARENYILCSTQIDHGLQEGDRITILSDDTEVVIGDYQVFNTQANATQFEIKTDEQIGKKIDESGHWTYIDELLDFSQPIAEFKSADQAGFTRCVSNDKEIQNGDEITVFASENYNGSYVVANVKYIAAEPDHPHYEFDIEYEFVSNDATGAEAGRWVFTNQPQDPYSFQLDFIFPNWPTRFQNPEFQELIKQIIASEIPAHIVPHIHWLNRTAMNQFEIVYDDWLRHLANKDSDPIALANSANKLINQLGFARVTTLITEDELPVITKTKTETKTEDETPPVSCMKISCDPDDPRDECSTVDPRDKLIVAYPKIENIIPYLLPEGEEPKDSYDKVIPEDSEDSSKMMIDDSAVETRFIIPYIRPKNIWTS